MCRTLHQVLHDYLTELVNTAQEDYHIILHTTIPEIPKQTIDFTRPSRGQAVKELEIRVLTPAFYLRFVHYAYTSEAFDRECIFTDEKNRTCWISRPELLAQLINQSRSEPATSTVRRPRGYLNELKWSLLKKLRCAPAEAAYNATPKSSEFSLEDVRATRFSEMDNFVRSHSKRGYAGDYRKIVTKLYLAQRFCLGFPQIITLIDWVLRMSMCYQAAKQMPKRNSVGRNASFELEWWSLSRDIAAVAASHVYGSLKGYR
jgi:hypothetical protein